MFDAFRRFVHDVSCREKAGALLGVHVSSARLDSPAGREGGTIFLHRRGGILTRSARSFFSPPPIWRDVRLVFFIYLC